MAKPGHHPAKLSVETIPGRWCLNSMTISRRSLVLGGVTVLAILAYVFWPGRRWNFQNLPPTATGPWVAFGDSLTFGTGAGNGGYPALLAARLGVPVQNLGLPGETTADGLKRLAEVEALQPRVVLLCFGGNDVLQGQPRDRMFANLSTMIDRLHAQGSFVVLIGIRGATLLRDANADGFAELAEQKQVMHIPNLLDGIIGSPSLMSDYVHPNDAGYEKIAVRLEKELKPLLPKLGGP
jgi:acyl-CoA thioesterase-1